MAQAWKVRLDDGRVLTPGEWSSTPLWTTVEINDGAITSLRGYSYGFGGDVPGSPGPRVATRADTNLSGSGGVVPDNQELLIYKIMVELFRVGTYHDQDSGRLSNPPLTAAADVIAIQRDTLLVMRIAETKEYIREGLGFFPAGMGVYEYNSAARGVAQFPAADVPLIEAGNGTPSVGEERSLATPHHVMAGEPFEITLVFPFGQVTGLAFQNADSRIRARIFADGYRRRPVA